MDRFRNVLVGVDLAGREHLISGRGLDPFSGAALDKARWVARRNRARLHLLSTLEIDAHAESLICRDDAAGRPNVLAKARERLESLAAPCREDGLEVTTTVGFGKASTALLADIAENGRDLVVVGHRGQGAVAARLMGSTVIKLVSRAAIPVWVARDGPDSEFDVVLAPVDFDDTAADILRLAEAFAVDRGARLHVLHAVDYSAEEVLRAGDASEEVIAEYHAQREKDARERFEALLARELKAPGAAERHVVDGSAPKAIHDLARRLGADLIVMGTHSRAGLGGTILGSTAERVLPHIDTSLLVLRPVAAAE